MEATKQMGLKPCRGCGREVDPGAKTCPGCGRSNPAVGRGSMLVAGALAIGLCWWGGSKIFGGLEDAAANVAPLTGGFERSINRKVADDAIEQYEIAKRSGSKMDACVHAGLVSAAMIQAKDEPGFQKWKAVEKADCRRAGVPQ